MRLNLIIIVICCVLTSCSNITDSNKPENVFSELKGVWFSTKKAPIVIIDMNGEIEVVEFCAIDCYAQSIDYEIEKHEDEVRLIGSLDTILVQVLSESDSLLLNYSSKKVSLGYKKVSDLIDVPSQDLSYLENTVWYGNYNDKIIQLWFQEQNILLCELNMITKEYLLYELMYLNKKSKGQYFLSSIMYFSSEIATIPKYKMGWINGIVDSMQYNEHILKLSETVQWNSFVSPFADLSGWIGRVGFDSKESINIQFLGANTHIKLKKDIRISDIMTNKNHELSTPKDRFFQNIVTDTSVLQLNGLTKDNVSNYGRLLESKGSTFYNYHDNYKFEWKGLFAISPRRDWLLVRKYPAPKYIGKPVIQILPIEYTSLDSINLVD